MEVSTKQVKSIAGFVRKCAHGVRGTTGALIVTSLFLSAISAVAQPTVQASAIIPIPNATATSLQFNWTNGNGGNRIVVIGTTNGVYTPVNGAPAPTPNTSFTVAPDLDPGAGDVRCVVNGNVSTVTVTNLTVNTPYWIRIYEYNGPSATPTYSFVANTTNPIYFQNVTTAGANTFNVPANVSTVAVKAWGGGGGGGGANEGGGERQGGGGGGGAFQFNNAIAVTAGGTVTVTVGAGGAAGSGGGGDPPGDPGLATTFGASLTANPGLGGTTATSGTPAGPGGNGGTGAFNGGNGQAGAGAANNGRGGGAAGDAANGANGSAGGAGGTSGGGAGGAAVGAANTNGNPGTVPGGGGSGGWEGNPGDENGGAGARGQAIITWTNPIPEITIAGSSTTIGLPLFQVKFSKPINTGTFTPIDVTITGTATGTLSAAIVEIAPMDGTTFTMEVSGMTATGTVIANIAAGAVTDPSGNTNVVSNAGPTINYTHLITAATVNPNAGNVIVGQPVSVTLTTAGAVTGLLAGAGSTINGVSVTGAFVDNTDGTYTFTYTPANGNPTWALNALPISLRLSDGTNTTPARTTFSGGSASATDLTVPVVNNQSLGTITSTGFTFTINLTEVGTTYWEVTTSATPPTAAQIKAGTGPGHFSNGNFAVGTPATNINQPIAGLASATLYYLYSVSEDGVTNQSTPVTTANATTLCAPPTLQATAAGSPFTAVLANGMTVNWVRGNGTGGVIVVARQTSAVSFVPSSGSTYAGQINANFTTAFDQGSGNKIVYRGPAASVVVTGLTPSTTYHYAVYEYNTANDCYMLTTPLLQNQATTALANEATLSNGTGTATISSLVVTVGAQVAVFSFDVTDAGADGAPTQISQMVFQPGPGNDFPNFTHLLPGTGAQLFDDDGNGPAGTLTVAAGTIQFAAIPNGAGQLGIIDNGTTKTYTLRVFLNNPLNAAIRATADQENFVLQLANTNITTAAGGSGMAASSVNSGSTNGVIDVTATRLAFIAQPTNTLLGVPMALVTVEATDLYGARDEQFTSTVGMTSTGTLSGTPVNAIYAAGVGSYNTLTHLAAATARTLTTNSGLINPVSNTFDITVSNASDIVVDAGFVYPTDIAYDTYQESVNITNSGTSLEVGRFQIRDGGAGLNDADVAPTIVSSITLNFTNFALIRRVELYDATGTVAIPGTEQVVSSANVTFGGLSLTASDNSSTFFSVRVSFRSLVTDNQQFAISVTTPTTTQANVSSTIPTPAGAVTSIAGNNNRIEVDAAQFRFIQQPTSSDVNAVMAPAVTVEAVDALNNRDLDYVSSVDLISTGSLTVSPQTTAFVAGLGTYNAVVHGVSGSGLQLQTNDGVLTNAASNPFQIVALSSNIVASAFAYPNNIGYQNHQEAVNITNSGTSLVVASFDISDGGVLFPDGDLAPTVLTNLTLDLGPNYTFIRRIALYNSTGLIEVPGSEQVVGSQTVNFGGLSLTAPDDGNLTFTVRVSFNALVVDQQQFSFTVTSATSQPGNSRFAALDAGGASTSIAGNDNRIQVTATRMFFAQHPVNTLNGVTMPNVIVHAVDGPGSIDIDFAMSVGLTSAGVMPVTPQFATFINGVGTYPSIVHTSNGAGLALFTNSILTNVASNAFNITSSAISDVISNAAFVYPTNIAYDNFQESVNIINSGTSLNVARFDIRDGGGAIDPDLAPTTLNSFSLDLGPNFGFIRRIALYDASGAFEIAGTEQLVVSQVVNFTGLSISAPDGGSTSFTVRVSFTAAVVDNQQFSFTMTAPVSPTPNTSSTFALANAGGAASLVTGDRNRIEVTATKVLWVSNMGSPTLAGIDITVQQAVPVVHTTDALNNIDRDYGTALTISCAIPTSTNTLTRDVAPPNGGVYTFPSNFQYTPQTGNGTLTISVGGLTSAISNPVIVTGGNATQIVAAAGAPATISSLVVTPGAAVTVFNFDITDDRLPLAPTNNDGLPTMFSSLVITANPGFNTITDWTQAIQGASLTDGTTTVPATLISGTPNSITFSGISTGVGQLGHVPDNGTKTYSLRLYLRSAMGGSLPSTVDGLQFQFEAISSNITPIANSTGFVLTSSNSGNNNVVTVVADRLRFISPAGPASASLNTPFPGVIVEATDIHNNRDRNFTGAGSTVREVSNVTAATMNNQPTVGTTQFGIGANVGLLLFNGTFQYITGANGDDVSLTVKAGPGPGTTCGVNGIICGTSNTINLLSSFESSIVADPTFAYLNRLDYAYFQEPGNLSAANSLEISRMLLVDGSRVGPPFTTGTETDGIPNDDVDGAATNLIALTLRITNPANIRRIALYSGGTEIPGTDTPVALAPGTLSFDFPFAGALATAPDGGQRDISVRVSFRNTAGHIRDLDAINVSVISASLSTGSSFFNGGPAYVAGVNGGCGIVTPCGFQSPLGVNLINVIATKLDFSQEDGTLTQPAPFAGIAPQPVVAGKVEAHDQWGLLDLEYNEVATVTAPVSVSASVVFNQGKLDLATMLYTGVGDGTVTVTAAGTVPPASIISTNLNNFVNGLSNVSVPCSRVDVIHVSTSAATNGVVTTTNLVGGTFNHIIFGVTFRSDHGVNTPSVAPKLESFVITFSNSINGVFLNTGADFPKVYESPTTTYNAGTATDITTFPGGNLVVGTTTITVNLGPAGRDLSVPGSELTYFLEIDVDPVASGSTPTVQPSLTDAGFGSPTDTNITTNFGTATSSVAGNTYSFAAIFPPILVSSYPATGQLNVDPNQSTIALTFGVPVWTLDERILLYNQTAGGPPVICTPAGTSGLNGEYNGGAGAALNTLLFNVPIALIENNVYFVTIAPGNLTNLTGIMDEANNTYPGFTFPGTLYFKAASSAPPKLLGPGTVPTAPTGPYMSNVTLNGATINATFDQQGKAYYLILKSPSPGGPPTNAHILAPGTYPAPNYVAGAGSFNIVQTNPISQYGLVQPIQTGLPGPIPPVNQFLPNQQYEVWMFAENNALPTPFQTAAPYGSGPLHAVGGAGPTIGLPFTTPPANPAGSGIVSGPTVSVCNNSYQIINQPLVISENVPGLFNTFGGVVSLNIGLPAGFQFDVSRTAGVPTYGRLSLLGSDFIPGSGVIDFLGNSIVRIRYASNGAGSLDKIIISNLRVLATGSSSGNLFRIGGTALTGPIPDLTNMGFLTSFDAPLIGFDNTYSKVALGNPPTSVVTSIPDNADDLDPSTLAGTIALIPVNPNANDFGPNSFTGLGVNINLLSLSAVTPDVPFNITIQHTDNNGCISNNAVQYTVYDNETAVKMSLPVPNAPPAGIAPTTFVQSPFTAKNTNFVNSTLPVNPYISPVLGVDRVYIAWNNLAGYYLRNTGPGATGDAIVAKIPSNAPPQIITGPQWASVIATLPVATGPTSNIPGGNPPTTQSFYFDLAHILNAPNLFPGIIPDPYSHFRSAQTAQGNYFYRGGSLGVIELTGTFQSTTNATVVVPRKQIIDIYVPPVPLVEVSIANRTFLDTTDPNNLPGTGGINGPTNKGTNVYCQAGGTISIFAYPAADPGVSDGVFTIVDAATSAPIFDESLTLTPLGFVDNGNGTAVLDPNIPIAGPGSDPLGIIRNNYRDIKIIYTYRDLAAPTLLPQSAYQIIRITPNPVAGFSLSTPVTAFVDGTSARCVGQPIQFTSTTSVTGDVTASVIDYRWDFGEVTSASNIIEFDTLTPPTAPQPAPFHTYMAASGAGSDYVVKHSAISNYGCLSGPPAPKPVVGEFSVNVGVGAIPIVKYKLEGVSRTDVFRFNSNNQLLPFPATGSFASADSLFSTIVSGNDDIKEFVWVFGDATANVTRNQTLVPTLTTDNLFNRDVVTHTYSTPGPKQIDLIVTTDRGCRNSLALQNSYRSIVVLDRVVLGAGSAYVSDFEPIAAPPTPGHRNWQVWGTGDNILEIQAGAASASWEYGPANGTESIPDSAIIHKANIWKTNIKNFPLGDPSDTYNPGENSALYSPSFDLRNLTRPMVSFNAISQLESSDGVVLEYSLDSLNIADPNKEWLTLGVIGTGEDWYTDQGIAGRPGTQTGNDFGWSRSDNKAWQAPKHVLDDLFPPNSTGVPTKAVFRFALGSASPAVDLQGFTLDNFRIGDRTRTILLESFANTSNTANEKTQNDYVQSFIGGVGTEVVKLNYHVNFPGKDPFNEDNPADPSSRALFYNIVTTPRSVLDGEKDPQDRLVDQWGQTLYNLRTLQLAQADIKIIPTVDPLQGTITVNVKVTSRVITGIQPNTILHVVFMEKNVPISGLSLAKQGLVQSGETNFEYVVKKMLPSAAGSTFGAVLPDTVSRFFGPFVYKPESGKLYPDPDDLVVAVFLQEATAPFEVFQVELFEPIVDPPVVTGLEPIAAESVLVYPNPANREMTVQLPGQLTKEAGLSLVDQTGRVTLRTLIPGGADRKTFNVSDLSSGVYILTIDMGTGVLVRKKVIIVHQE